MFRVPLGRTLWLAAIFALIACSIDGAAAQPNFSIFYEPAGQTLDEGDALTQTIKSALGVEPCIDKADYQKIFGAEVEWLGNGGNLRFPDVYMDDVQGKAQFERYQDKLRTQRILNGLLIGKLEEDLRKAAFRRPSPGDQGSRKAADRARTKADPQLQQRRF
jgi:hypothetical protein